MSGGIQISVRQAAKIAGVAYVALFVLGIFANFFVREGLVVAGDAAATVANIQDSELLFRFGIVSFLIIFVLDVVIAWLLYIIFRSESRDISLVAAWFRLIYTVFLGVAIIFFFVVLQLLSGADYLSSFSGGQIEAQAMLYLDAFNFTWLIGLLMFGIHLIVLGYLILKSVSLPKYLGVLLVLAGSGYVVDTLAFSILSDYDQYKDVFLAIVAIPSIVGELAFTIWLFMKAGKNQVVGS